MLLFRSEEHADRWTRERGTPPGAFLGLERQWELSRTWYEGLLEPTFRRRTVQEAQAAFTALGLTDSFWSLTG